MSEDLKEKLGELVHYYGISGQKWLPIIKELKELTEREAKLVAALKFYTNEDNWNAKIYNDEGKTAEATLSELSLLGE